VLEWDQTKRLDACLEAGAKIISFFWGDARPYLSTLQKADVKVIVIVGSTEEARRVPLTPERISSSAKDSKPVGVSGVQREVLR
jgi:hypothetical protein